MQTKTIKDNIEKAIFESLFFNENILSVTLVGSFVDKKDLTGISDIDTIVICNKLEKKIFDECINQVKSIDLKKCGLSNYSLLVNSTFGPLKFDSPNVVVIHLMIYDVEQHRKHVVNSPFTCFDWERSDTYKGQALKNIFPVGTLQYRDFVEVRRSLNNYLEDLKNNNISYRFYKFEDSFFTEIKKYKFLDKKHKGEYSYHIIKNLVSNYLKLINCENIEYSVENIEDELNQISSNHDDDYSKNYRKIYDIKLQRGDDFPPNILKWTENFLLDFQKKIVNDWAQSININFIRHYKTNLNDGTFLGQGRNPSINIKRIKNKIDISDHIVFSSPLKRCVETANFLGTKNLNFDKRLLEFNYGKAEGLTYDELAIRYPKLIRNWDNKIDSKFPNGENTTSVFNRMKSFTNDLTKIIDEIQKRSVSIITHNGFIRCLIGDAFEIKLQDWYKLEIPHGVPLNFLLKGNKLYPNIPRGIFSKIFKNVGYKSK